MSKIDKKRIKIKDRITFLENELRESLTKKTSDSVEINIGTHQRKINALKLDLSKL